MLIIYSAKSLGGFISSFKQEVVVRSIASLWDIHFIESLYSDVMDGHFVVVVNPSFEILDKDSFIDFVEFSQKESKNVYYSPQINPHFFVNEPVWFSVRYMGSIQNFFIEFLYKNQHISSGFRNLMHKQIRKHSISRLDIPKYLTNLDDNWVRYCNGELSKNFLNTYSNIYFKNPTNVHIAISNRCNLKCVMCPYHSPEITKFHTSDFFNKANYMDIDTFSKIAQYCGENGIFMQFGQLDEPLLHPRFLDFLDIARKFNVCNINLTTNGTLLDRKIALGIVQSNIKSITFSLDAIDKQSYKEIRGYDYDKTLANIEYLLECLESYKKTIDINVCFILQGKNAESKSKEFLEYWISRVKKVKFHKLTEFFLNKEKILVAKNQGVFREDQEQRYPCSIPWQTLFVTPDSKVTFCCASMAEYSTSGLDTG